ncbi:hypothetical protein ZWY2020_008451 [Hordeum vulgare]|nr:hypothetical protein ZWY2020_008451 [Hordeum vulgare]
MSFCSGSCKLNKLAATYSADGLSCVLNEKRYWKNRVSVDSPAIRNERSGAAGTLVLPSYSCTSAGTETGSTYIGGRRILKWGAARGTWRAWLWWGGTTMARGHGWAAWVDAEVAAEAGAADLVGGASAQQQLQPKAREGQWHRQS